jgi:hypothetical protein
VKLPINYEAASRERRLRVRHQYMKEQDGKCYHCDTDLEVPPEEDVLFRVNRQLFPEGFFRWPVHLHHSHNTGMTIGAVHAHCNAVLWQYHGE